MYLCPHYNAQNGRVRVVGFYVLVQINLANTAG